MYFYSFSYDYEIDTILCSNKKWTNGELLTILTNYKKNHEYSDTFYCDFLNYLVDTYDFNFLDIEDYLDVFDMRSVDYSDLPPVDTNFNDIPNITHIKDDMFKNCGYIDFSGFKDI